MLDLGVVSATFAGSTLQRVVVVVILLVVPRLNRRSQLEYIAHVKILSDAAGRVDPFRMTVCELTTCRPRPCHEFQNVIPHLYTTSSTFLFHKKLSCRKDTARRFMSLNIKLSHPSSLKVIRNDTVE